METSESGAVPLGRQENDAEPALVPEKTVQANVSTGDVENGPVQEWKPGKQEWLVMFVLILVSLMAAIDATILVPALPVLASKLHGSAIDTFWAGTSYLLANAVCQPLFATLSDIFGRQQLLFHSVLLFTIGTIICCTANGFTQLLTGRTVQGLGGGGIIVMAYIILTDIIPLRQRPKYNSFVQISWALGSITGPLIGGAISEDTTWRWIFYLNFPPCAAALVLIPFILKFDMDTTSFKSKLTRFDWFGSLLFIASMTSFLIAITWGGVQFQWGAFQTLVPLILGVVGLATTLLWEQWGTKVPFLRLLLFNNRSAILMYISIVLQGMLMYGGLYYIPFYLASVKNQSPIQTGVGLLPTTIALTPTSIIIGILLTRTGRIRWALWSGWAFACLGYGLLIILDEKTPTVGWVFILIVVGLAQGFLLNTIMFGVQATSEPQDVAYAAAMYAFSRTFGQSIGVAIGGTVFQNLLAKHLQDQGLPTSIAKDAEGFVKTLRALPLDSVFRAQVIHAYVQAFHGVFGVMLGIAGLGLVLSLGVGKLSLNKPNESQHVLRKK